MLEVAGLSVQYGQHRAVDDVALSVGAGEIVVILGANGSGKSSLLKAVAGLQPPARRRRGDAGGPRACRPAGASPSSRPGWRWCRRGAASSAS